MKAAFNSVHGRQAAVAADRKWIAPLAIGATVSLVLLLFLTTLSSPDFPLALLPLSLLPSALLSHPSNPFAALYAPVFVESKLRPAPPASLLGNDRPPPRLAYLISGTVGDGNMIRRVLLALYHPANRYVVHLDLEASAEERDKLRDYVASHPLFASVGNVRMITKANLVTYRGPTMVANTLHAAAILLKEGGDWDWFINLSASDYPLVTQDDLLHTFSYLPRDLNFIDHTSNIGWKEFQRAKPVIIDPGLYLTKKADVFWIPQRRSVPTAFKLFTGSAWMALSHSFIDYCIWGWDNLPRTVFMYYANFISSPEGYFHTVICNAQEFRNTTVNHDLHFISWDNPPKQHPHYLNLNDMARSVASNAPFARKFRRDHPILDKIDTELLLRRPNMIVPGGWCAGSGENGSDPCMVVGNTTFLRPGPGATRLEQLMQSLLSNEKFHPRQCK
ncbi:beta-glucuronosyltransferase GlcAT14B-like [Zingiber officinale]|uniref:beta-glucuronosyltransferase GlcAT14B-like n=1 Tax=Zingiber officinale TaxID=94328 RepID=UPI001C4BCC7F|nr:beta-glucuronosyltransferase GlcAT14B-like [Zingiber officinale]